MEEQMKLTVNLLKERINYNLQIIRRNEEAIQNVLSQPISNERTNLLNEKISINRKLQEENDNSKAIEIQITNYLNKYSEVLKQKNVKSSGNANNETSSLESFSFQIKSKSEQLIENEGVNLFNLTLSGDIPFDIKHPKFYDEKFYNLLFECFKLRENYEMCAHLLKVKEIK